ncbi:MAG TPA: radical SAM protein [Dehalococcoidales bacterium]|nr:radical SAM protein [Dehalococcoidales bacterium]
MAEKSINQVLPPFLISYSITTKCNLKCKHCYSDSSPEAGSDDLTTEESLRVIDDIAGWGIGLLVLDGGEPLLREDFFQIAEYASGKGITAGIGSNGSLIDAAVAKRLVSVGIRYASLSIDGADAETHDTFRGEVGNFDQVLRAALACKQAGLPFQFNAVLRKKTLPQISDIFRLAQEYGAFGVELFDLILVGRATRECRDEVLTLEEKKGIVEWLAETQIDYPLPIETPSLPMYPLLLKLNADKGICPRNIPMEQLVRTAYYNRGCAAGRPRGYLVIRNNGEVNPCIFLQVNLGNVRDKGIRQIWQESPVLAQLRSRDLLKGECGKCQYKDICVGCRGRAYAETGDMLASDPGCWLTPSA